MQILVVGGGAREHAIARSLVGSPSNPGVLVAPGNPGTASIAENVPVRADDIDGQLALVGERGIDLVVVGPEVPLVMGLADRLGEAGVPVVGPSAAAARLEGSKAFAKEFMARHGIPTASYRTFTADQYGEARAFVEEEGAPIVVKASGLAAGKGAIVCGSVGEALGALTTIMRDGEFGGAGDFVVVESFMKGEEASLFAISDGSDYVMLASAQDHKRIGEDDTGPNTGGMGAYAPAPIVTARIEEIARRRIIEPTLAGMRAEGTPYRGVLYVGLMIDEDGPRVVEFNCRLGDPEAQVVLPLFEGDAVELFERAASGRLSGYAVAPPRGAAACVVMASAGYPGPYEKGMAISGIEKAEALEGIAVFHAGTSGSARSGYATSGGRVLTVSAVADSLGDALDRAYRGVGQIAFEGAHFRRDIGRKGMERLRSP
jgi:phosphoribosylamine--glycine ligase